MPRRSASKEYRAFVGGLVTEASPLTFPENASFAEDNCVLKSDGSRRRRLGMNPEESGPADTSIASTQPNIVEEFLWKSVASIATLLFRVVQIDNTLYFYESNDTDALVPNKKNFTVNLNSFSFTKTDSSTSQPGTKHCSFASGKGILLVANEEMDTFFIEYDSSSDSIVTSKINIEIRDFSGVEDGLQLEERPSSLSNTHEYNLLNQGWRNPEDPLTNPNKLIEDFKTSQNVYPSNSDKLSTGYERFINTNNDTVVNFTPTAIVKAQVGTSPASKGSQIYNFFKDDRSISGTPASSSFFTPFLGGTTYNFALTAGDTFDIVLIDKSISVEINRATVTIPPEGQTAFEVKDAINSAFSSANFPSSATASSQGQDTNNDPFADEFKLTVTVDNSLGLDIQNDNANFVNGLSVTFDGGTPGTQLSTTTPKDIRPGSVAFFSGRAWYTSDGGDVLFSQILEDNFSNIGKCYQSNDPTSIESPDLLDNDGGLIKIPEASNWKGGVIAGTSLILYAENGAWEIRGVDEFFKATDIVVNKITSKGVLNKRAWTETDSVPVWLSSKGIHTLAFDDVSGSAQATDVTSSTVQTFTDNIPIASRKAAQIVYDFSQRVIIMLYNSDGNNPEQFDRQLNISVKLEGAVYPWSFGKLATNSPIIYSAAPTEKEYDLATGPWSTAYLTLQENSETAGNWDLSFCLPNNRKFRDWQVSDDVTDAEAGANYKSFIDSGFDTFEDIRRDKAIDSINIYLKRTETEFLGNETDGYTVDFPSSCILTVKFDFTDNDQPKKWHEVGEVYRRSQDFRPEDTNNTDFDNGFPVNIVKESVRGNGRAVQYRFESSEGKDFHLIGWAVDVSVGERS